MPTINLRSVCLGTVSIVALSIGLPDDAFAQSSELPTVTVTAPKLQAARRAQPTRRARPRPAPAAPSQLTSSRPGPAVVGERGTGPALHGYVAQQSVTATKTDTPLLTTPQAVSVVPRRQIDDQQPQTLSETLRYTLGATVNSYGANSVFDTIKVRGFEVPIYLDGLRLPVDPGTTFASQRLEPFGLERVEVLRGPSSGLYGQSPPGGLVNAVSKRPQLVPYADLILQGGNFDRAQGAFDFNGPLESTGQWLVRMTGLVREAGTQLDFQRDNRYFFAPSLTWRPDADTSFTILASVQKSNGRGYQQYVPATGTVLPNPFGHIPYSRYLGEPDFDRFSTAHAAIGYSFEHRFNNHLQFRQSLRYSTASTDLQALRVDGVALDQRTAIRTALGVKASTENLTVDNQLQLDVATGPLQHKVLFGVDYYTQKGSSFFNMAAGPNTDLFAPVYGQAVAPVSTFATALDSRSHQQQTGIYVQDQIKLDRLVVTATARADRADSTTTNFPTAFGPASETQQHDNATTGRIGASYLFDNGVAPYAAYATSFQPTPGTTFAGTPFRPTTGTSREIGVKYRPVSTNALFTLAFFDITQQNVLTTDTANPFFSIQTGEIRVKGVEFESRFSLTDRFDLIAGYSHIDPRITKNTTPVVGNVVAGVPLETASLWGLYKERTGVFAGWGIGAGARNVGKSYSDSANTFAVPSYTVFDALVSYDFAYLNPHWRGLTFQLNVNNLTNEYYVSNCSGRVYCALGNARAVFGTLRYHFQSG
jgi:iron complex outermembrane receptor protein